jgi:DNA-directed RNA polymerase subunit H (RpoH/RPB5)
LFITKDDLNDRNTTELNFIWKKDGIFIVVIGVKHLQFDLLEHSLVPNHRLLTNDETEVVMKRYNINSLQKLPEISRFDPVSKIIGIRPGQVCEIIRPSKAAIESLYYRVCV